MIASLFAWLERERDPRPIALLRITLFLGVLVHFLPSLLAHDVEYAVTAARARLHNGWLYDHLAQTPRVVVGALAVALVLALVLGVVGFATRAASAVTMALTWVFASWNALPVQTIALLCAWSLLPVLAVLPGASSTWSVEAWLARRQGRRLPPPALVANLSLFLVVWPVFFAGVEKLVAGWLANHEMAMLFRTPPGYILRDVAALLPLRSEWFAAAIGWFTVFVELTAPVLLAFRRTRAVGLALWLALFSGIVALIEVPPLFGAVFVFGVFLCLDADEIDRLLRRRTASSAPSAAPSSTSPSTSSSTPSAAALVVGVLVGVGGGCAPSLAPSPPDPTADWFRRDAALPVEVAVGEQAWETLRHQHHDVAAVATSLCSGEPPADVYDWQHAHARVDGVVHAAAAVRKKGFFGSDDTARPSLKLKWRDAGDVASTTLTLNNAVADPSLLRQCLAALVFERVGVPTPRCGFARVVVDGVDRGVFVHVESLKPPFLLRAWGEDDGALYEGRLADFRDGMDVLFEGKDGADPARDASLAAVTAALTGTDDTLLPALERALDLPGFLRFWAAEVLVAHVDGYANNRNNFALWRSARDGRLRFIPWGLDETFEDRGTLQAPSSPFVSVMARGRLARRLFLHPEGRARFTAALRTALHDAWDEPVLLDAIDDMAAMLAEHHAGDQWRELDRAIARTRAFVEGRRAQLLAELEGDGVVWTEPELPAVCRPQGAVDVAVATRLGTLHADPFVAGRGDSALSSASIGARAGRDREGRFVLEVALDDGNAALRVLRVVAPWDRVRPGAVLPFGGTGDDATALVLDVVATDGATTPRGVLVDGGLVLGTAADPDAVVARVHGTATCVALLGGRCDGDGDATGRRLKGD